MDLRYDGQIIVNPDLDGMARQPALTPAAAKKAMAAGVRTAAIVNYEKYVTYPVPPAPVKKEVKPKAKAAVHQAAAHHAPVKPGIVKSGAVKPALLKQAPVNQAALRTRVTSAPVAAAKNTVPSRSAVPARAGAVTPGQKKPNAGIPKETPQS